MNRKRVVFVGVLGLAAALLLFLPGAGVAAPGGGHGGGGHGGGGHGGGGHGGGGNYHAGSGYYHGGYSSGYYHHNNGNVFIGIGVGLYPGFYRVYGPAYSSYD